MLVISFHHNSCTISHERWRYEFDKDFLTPPLWTRFRRLLPQHRYALSGQQSIDLATLFYKIDAERNSTYLFTEALQRTYLIELIHFILKLKTTPQIN